MPTNQFFKVGHYDPQILSTFLIWLKSGPLYLIFFSSIYFYFLFKMIRIYCKFYVLQTLLAIIFIWNYYLQIHIVISVVSSKKEFLYFLEKTIFPGKADEFKDNRHGTVGFYIHFAIWIAALWSVLQILLNSTLSFLWGMDCHHHFTDIVKWLNYLKSTQ